MSFCGVIVETAMNITFPALMSHFGIGTSSVQWMTTLYLLVVASITPISAALKRRFRSRTLFLCANLLFLTGLVIDALAPVFPLLLLGRAIQGLGTSIALPLMFNIILQQVPAKRIGTMMGRHPDYGHRTSRRSHLWRSGSNHHRLAFRLRHPDSHTAHLAGDRPGLHTLSSCVGRQGSGRAGPA